MRKREEGKEEKRGRKRRGNEKEKERRRGRGGKREGREREGRRGKERGRKGGGGNLDIWSNFFDFFLEVRHYCNERGLIHSPFYEKRVFSFFRKDVDVVGEVHGGGGGGVGGVGGVGGFGGV